VEELVYMEEAHFQFPLSAFVAPPDPEEGDDDDDDEERQETLDAVILAALVSP
jgi:hypothetical protein